MNPILLSTLAGVLAGLPDDGRPAIRLEALDPTVEMQVRLDEDATFQRSIRLTLTGGYGGSFAFLPSDLRGRDGRTVVDRGVVRLLGERLLVGSVPRDFTLRLQGSLPHGEYDGTLEFLLEAQPARRTSVPFHVVVSAAPELRALGRVSAARLHRAGCLLGHRLCVDDWLATALVPAELRQDELTLAVRNSSPAAAVPVRVRAQLAGRASRAVLAPRDLAAPAEILEPVMPGDLGRIPLLLAREAVRPGRYAGHVEVNVVGAAAPLDVPVDLEVRAAPSSVLARMALGWAGALGLAWLWRRRREEQQVSQDLDRLRTRLGRAPRELQDRLRPRWEALRGEARRGAPRNVQEELDALHALLDQAGASTSTAAFAAAARGDGAVAGPVRALAYLGVLGGLAAAGLHAFYLAPTGFLGTGGIIDTMVALLWGLTAGVTAHQVVAGWPRARS